ncbi:MAG TPA: hypothetical protein VGT40_11325 [Methylomirabilota bacterium]|nr:hypothetical protein [Methylomirabilota bacterium]
MTRRSFTLTLAVIAGLLFVTTASAMPSKPPQRYLAVPFEFVGAEGDCGEGSAAGEDTVHAAWVTHDGLPDAGKSDHALLLAKSGATANCASAGAKVYKVEGITLTELGYDVRDDGDCSANAPRFEIVMSEDGLHTVGCADGPVTETLTDRRDQSWSRKRWSADDLADGALASPPITPDSGTVVSITLVFDDGEDASDESTGHTFVDNIDVNGTLMGKPGLAKPPAH